MPQVLDIEQAVLLLELEPPFDKRDVQLARRRLAKQWHPDIAPPGRQHEHERHLKAINEAADQLRQLAEESRGGRVSKNAVKVSAAAARKRRAEEGARAYAEEQRQRAQDADRAKHDPFASRVPDHSVVHRYARCLSYPEWGVGSVQRHLLHRRRRRHPAVGAGLLPARDPHRARGLAAVRRLLEARPRRRARAALHDRGQARARRGRLQARRAAARCSRATPSPANTQVLRLMTLAFWQAGDYSAAGRAVRDWIRAERERPAPYRYAARIYEDMGALSQAVDAAERETAAAPERRVGVGAAGPAAAAGVRSRRARARRSSARARPGRPSRACSTSRWSRTCSGDVGAEVSACEQATQLAPESEVAWARYAHALARTDRVSDCLEACERALALADDPEVRDLRDQVARMVPRELRAA